MTDLIISEVWRPTEKWFIPTSSVQRGISHSGNNYFMDGRVGDISR